ncbi:hypothetical protein ACRAWD_28520 [Caulobacter segnis]
MGGNQVRTTNARTRDDDGFDFSGVFLGRGFLGLSVTPVALASAISMLEPRRRERLIMERNKPPKLLKGDFTTRRISQCRTPG